MLNINISAETRAGVISGEIPPSELLLLETVTAEGRIWKIETVSEMTGRSVAGLTREVIAKGGELEAVFRSIANGDKSLPAKFIELARNAEFNRLARRAPGMETVEHRREVQTNIQAKMVRVRNTLKEMGKGTSALKVMGKPGKMIKSEYALVEIVLKDFGFSIDAAQKFAMLWKTSETLLDFNAWLRSMRSEWLASGTTQEILPWLCERDWNKMERQAWESSHPGEVFTLDRFSAWQRTQYDPHSLLADPLWNMRADWEKENADLRKKNEPEISFDQWKINETAGRRKFWQREIIESGLLPFTHLDDATFKILDRKMFEYNMQSGSSLKALVWIAKELWKETGPTNLSDEAFVQYIEYNQYVISLQNKIQPKIEKCEAHLHRLQEQYLRCKSGKVGRAKKNSLREQIDLYKHKLSQLKKAIRPSKTDFEMRLYLKEANLRSRWNLAKAPLTFDKWKSQQVLNPLVPMPFVRLNAVDRKAYQVDCVRGELMRKGELLTTSEESTAHSGKNWVIFVLSPQGKLYCGSHLPGVFHHSSFLSDAAILGAGEIKTDAFGKITHISSKSGHYKPTDAENREMLRWFGERGVDLKEIQFTCFLPDGNESLPMNADAYLHGAVPLAKSK